MRAHEKVVMRSSVVSLLHTALLGLMLAAGPDIVAAPLASAPAPTYEERLVALINGERLSNGGLPPLKRVAELDTASEGHSTNMASRDFLMHCDPDTKTLPWDRMAAAGYTGFSAAAENLAGGPSTPEAVVALWMGSTSHRSNILSPDYRELGAGYLLQASDQATVRQDSNGDCIPDSFTNGPYYHYWTQDFGLRSSVYPVIIEREAFSAPTLDVALYVYGPNGATHMRFSNDGATWSDWEPYSAAKNWTLSRGNGQKLVYAQVTTGATTTNAQDGIWLDAPPPVAPAVTITPATVGVLLTWQHAAQNRRYDVYRSTVEPYLTPGGTSATHEGADLPPPATGSEVTFPDPGATQGANYYYIVRASAGDGVTYADSNRVGRFEFAILSGG